MKQALSHGSPRRRISLALSDAPLTLAAVTAAARFRLGAESWNATLSLEGACRVVLLAAILQACFVAAGLYDARRISDSQGRITAILLALGSASIIMAFVYFGWPNLMIGRGVFMIAAVLAGLLMLLSSLVRTSRERRSAGLPDAGQAAVSSR